MRPTLHTLLTAALLISVLFANGADKGSLLSIVGILGACFAPWGIMMVELHYYMQRTDPRRHRVRG